MKKEIAPVILFFTLLFSSVVAAHPGIGIVMDSKGNVFYTDLTHVWKIAPDGSCTIAVKDVHTHELYLDENDNLFGEHVWYEGEATDKWGYYIWCLKSNGSLEQAIPPTEGFPFNNTLVRDSEGSMYWPEKSGDIEILKKETANGQTSLYTDYKFKDIRWLHFSENNNLYVIDYLKIKKVTPSGDVVVISDKLKETWPSHAEVQDHHYLMGLWSDAQQNIFVAVYGARKVKKITPSGKIETVFESSKDWSPSGGLIGPDGSYWIMEFSVKNKTRVKKISPYGDEVVYDQN
ncbi:NHL repeat-containing protein [Kriegella aquimaris]|uniref:WD40-like Beta Propeller Repeat n=1 Tax=Kriegella aquimaris TaxID=192904 RepID=A0A1G9W1Y1_9FLAO|nr:hypothetical protein [Kriegella aquimaris]SDM78558.1 hypothetical protein SAMN04488514_114136 [Kriegella aquimaris]